MADEVLDRLTEWAIERAGIHAVILTSTRAIPGAALDAYSDYDVVLVVDDVVSMAQNQDWLADFGDLLISYWDPVNVNPETGAVWVGSVNNYVNGLKIDFGLWSPQRFVDVTTRPQPHPEFDAGHRVLIDKIGLTGGLPAPTYAAYIPERPDEPTFQRLIVDFLIGVPYVAKSLLRNELLPAKWVLDCDMRSNYLVPMLEWRVECDHDWSLKTGSLGKGLKKYLPADTWAELENTMTGPAPEDNWDALFTMVALFARLAQEVATRLGYRYPSDLVDRVTEHARQMRQGDYAAGPRSPGQSGQT
ncbi:aminoglycoside 6-adenylyltransferase [Microlunatus speluncae]|uniref:aminoglycoside 6-adenylyltransferase n=1 Tax=Microlunatus speluncae TaxID=2594267 RepID=UPI001375DEC8|nr:aminoglycoside 6-adenylyltransferase [Microlunatus speluncae]